MKNELILFLSSLPSEKERQYELQMTNYVLKQDFVTVKTVLNEILTEERNTQIAYNAFYCLNIVLRREKNYLSLQELFDNYGTTFRRHITFEHLKALFLIESDSLYDYSEVLDMTYRDSIMFDNNAGFVHLFADVFATIYERGGIRDKDAFLEEWYQLALETVNKAIDLDSTYAKYYCTKARILSINGEYLEAETNINKAISYENSNRKDYALRISNYQYYKMMIVSDRKLHTLENKIWQKLNPMIEDGVITRTEVQEVIAEVNDPVVPINVVTNIKSVDTKVVAYTGKEPYIFVSYSHRDSEVMDVIALLQGKGYNVWFDEGLIPGNEYAEEIANKIEGASVFMLMVSPNSINSEFVRKELTHALNNKLKPICVFIKDTTLSSGMSLQLNIYEYIKKYLITDDEFLRKAMSVLDKKLGG